MYTLIFPNEEILKTIKYYNDSFQEWDSKDTFSVAEAEVNFWKDKRTDNLIYSCFNYWQHRANVHVVFNSLYNTLSVFSNEDYDEFINLRKIL